VWWLWLILALIGAPLTLFLHELAHSFVVWGEGGRVTSFKPYPHFADGHFYFGRVEYLSYQTRPRLFFAAPALIKAPVFLVVWATLGLLFCLPLLALAAWELWDLLNFVQGYMRKSSYNDGGLFRAA
jgi:hypothetical protein